MKTISRYFGPVLAAVIFIAALVVLSRQFTLENLRQVANNVLQLLEHHPLAIVAALAFTVANYVVLVGYDLLAVRYLGIDVPLRKIAFCSFTAYACSANFNATVAGTSIRYRLYFAWGVAPAKILRLLVVLALTFWFGMLALAGAVFIFAPLSVPAEFHLAFHDTRPLGVVLMTIAVLYVAMSLFFEGSISIPYTSWKLPVPPFALTVNQILVSSLDLLLVAAVLYCLWPANDPIGYFRVLDIYLLVFVLGVLAHIPGGYGVNELVLATVIPDKSIFLQVLASWLLFRMIYQILPLLLAAVMLGWYEVKLFKRKDAGLDDRVAVECE
jgi:uncharacterized membrane protein YbhN (UPF0104 family)